MGQCITAELKNRKEHQITLQDQDEDKYPSVNSSLLAGIDSGFFIEKALKYSKKDDEQQARKYSGQEGIEQAKDDPEERIFMRQDCKADFTENSQSQEEKEEDKNDEEEDVTGKDQENLQYFGVNASLENNQTDMKNSNNNNMNTSSNFKMMSNNSQILKKSNSSSSYPVNPVISSTSSANPVQRQISFQKQCSIQKQVSIAKQLSIQKQNSFGLKQGSSFLSTFPTQLLSPRSAQSQANLGLFTSQSSLNPLLKVSYINGVTNNNNTNPGSTGIASQLSNIPSSTNSLPTSSSNIMQTATTTGNIINNNNNTQTSNSNPNITSSSTIPDKNILSPNNPRRSSSQDRRSKRKNPADKKMSLTVIDFSNRFNNHQSLQQQLLSPHRVSSQQTEFEEILTLLNRQNVDVYIIQQLCNTFLERRRREYGDQAEEFQEAVRNLSVVLFKQQLNDLGRFYLDQLVLQKTVSTQQNLLKNLHEYQMKHV